MTPEEFAGFNIKKVVKRRKFPQSKIDDEFTVEFGSVCDRDCFRAYANRLHSFQRKAGMRLSLPDYLTSSFKVLENESFRLVRRRPGTKRSIKFDDMKRSLVMDVKLPDSGWVRITPEEVLAACKSRKQAPIPAVQEILDIGGQELEGLPFVPPIALENSSEDVGGQDEEMEGEDVGNE